MEILWQVGLTGQHKARDLSDTQLTALANALLDIPRLSYTTRGQVDDNKHHGALFRFKVFHRDGEPCERCGGSSQKPRSPRARSIGVHIASINAPVAVPLLK